jgi:Zn-finger domain-containing protein
MKKTKKAFDCVEMMHRGALQIHEKIKDMTMEEEMSYWREREEEARKKYPGMRTAPPNAQPGS